MKPLTETEIRESMVNAHSGEAARMPVPGLHEVVWDDREYLGWRDPQAPQRGYLVFWRGDTPVGLALRAAESRMTGGAALCSLCQTQQPAHQVRLFSAPRPGEAGRAGNTVGTYICSDLACSLLIRMGPPTSRYEQHPAAALGARSAGLIDRLHSFTARVLDTAA